MKIIVAPDKFKGSLTSMQVCECISRGILSVIKDAEVLQLPMADGGDGFAAVMKYYCNTETIHCNTFDPLMRNITAGYEWDKVNKTAIIELAASSGLVLLKQEERDPLNTSTYGTGLMIQQAINNGASKIMLGIGGSATNDGGIGILAALGFIFKDINENILSPVGESLLHIHTIEKPSHFSSVQFVIASDVTNVLCGKDGAAYIFGPQKGADENAVQFLDKGLEHFAGLIKTNTGKDIASFAGSGAAGGVAAGLSAFFETQIESGALIVVKTSQLEKQLPGTALLITGEGKLDGQTLHGKVVQQLALLADSYGIPTIIICGENKLTQEAVTNTGITAVVELINETITKEHAMVNAAALLTETATRLAKEYYSKNK